MYFYLQKQNQLTYLRITIPKISERIRSLKEEIAKCEYELDMLESPVRLMELASSEEYSHLKHPYAESILTLGEGSLPNHKVPSIEKNRTIPVAIGVGQ